MVEILDSLVEEQAVTAVMSSKLSYRQTPEAAKALLEADRDTGFGAPPALAAVPETVERVVIPRPTPATAIRLDDADEDDRIWVEDETPAGMPASWR